MVAGQSETTPEHTASGEMSRDDVLDHLEVELGGIESLMVVFRQEKHLSIFAKPVESTGRLWFKAPNAVRFEITDPFQSVLIVSGKQVAKYEGLGSTWKKVRIGNTRVLAMVMQQITVWLRGQFREHDGIFTISVLDNDGKKTVVLEPKHERFRQLISSIDLVLDNELTRFTSMTIHEQGGDFTVMHFIEESRGLLIDSQIFDASSDHLEVVTKGAAGADANA